MSYSSSASRPVLLRASVRSLESPGRRLAMNILNDSTFVLGFGQLSKAAEVTQPLDRSTQSG